MREILDAMSGEIEGVRNEVSHLKISAENIRDLKASLNEVKETQRRQGIIVSIRWESIPNKYNK